MKISLKDIQSLPKDKQIKFALFCAKQVKHLMKDERSLNALSKLELFIENKIDLNEMKAAAYAAADAAVAAVAYAAADAADAADAYAAADAAVAAVAADAYAAADAAEKEIILKQVEYFNELVKEK